MNVTFLIGNGFDIGLGLKSRYTDFYDDYCKMLKNDDENIRDFKKTLSDWKNTEDKEIRDWSDFEKAFGDYSEEFDLNTKRKYIHRFEHFVRSFNAYLERIEKNIGYTDEKLIVNTMSNAINNFYCIRPEDQIEIKTILSTYSSNPVYSFISFNYTKCLDNCVDILRNSIDQAKLKIGQTIHVHGYVDKNMIMGLNDATQIKNPHFARDPEIISEIVKPEQNKLVRTNYDNETREMIDSSDVICIYGMSLGETDRKWWEHILNWLSYSEKRVLIILIHDNAYNVRFPFLQKTALLTKQRFLKYAEESVVSLKQTSDRIYVGVNYDIFGMKLYKEEPPKSDVHPTIMFESILKGKGPDLTPPNYIDGIDRNIKLNPINTEGVIGNRNVISALEGIKIDSTSALERIMMDRIRASEDCRIDINPVLKGIKFDDGSHLDSIVSKERLNKLEHIDEPLNKNKEKQNV